VDGIWRKAGKIHGKKEKKTSSGEDREELGDWTIFREKGIRGRRPGKGEKGALALDEAAEGSFSSRQLGKRGLI